MSMSIKARPQVTRFLVPEKNLVSQKPCITRLVKNQKNLCICKAFGQNLHISSVFGPNSKPCIFNVSALKGPVSLGLSAVDFFSGSKLLN